MIYYTQRVKICSIAYMVSMTATAIIRDSYKMNDDYILTKQAQDDDDKESALNKYYRSYNNFMPYQYAIYTTAHARDALFTMIECVGYDNFLYCDTDSVFYIETENNKKSMENYAEFCRNRAKTAKMFVENKYLGEPTDEPPLRAFRAIHSKCYAMEEMNKHGEYELNVVIAGIPKGATKWIDGKPVFMTNAQELGNIDNLADGFVFEHCGGTRCVYNDERGIEHIEINGHMTELATSAVIENISKEISDTMYTAGKDYTPLNIVQDAQ